MIASVSGRVAAVSPDGAVVEVGGIGLAVQCTPATIARLQVGEAARLSTSLVVREDSLTLYGFASADEREFFELLLTATGVGPKLAQAALAVLPPDQLRAAIASENLVQLCKVPGVGRKGAQRMVIELKDKINAVGLSAEPHTSTTAPPAWRDQVGRGLVGLGWSEKDADAACSEVEPMVAEDPDVSVAVLMRAALQSLARG